MTTTRDPDFASTIDSDIVRTAAKKPERLLSIDVLRGLTITFMILVNDQTGPAPFHQLSHADWNGFTATDLVFPTFLFLVGLTTVLSTEARLARGATRKEIFLHTLRRALLLIVFGFVVNNFPLFHLATARYYGVSSANRYLLLDRGDALPSFLKVAIQSSDCDSVSPNLLGADALRACTGFRCSDPWLSDECSRWQPRRVARPSDFQRAASVRTHPPILRGFFRHRRRSQPRSVRFACRDFGYAPIDRRLAKPACLLSLERSSCVLLWPGIRFSLLRRSCGRVPSRCLLEA